MESTKKTRKARVEAVVDGKVKVFSSRGRFVDLVKNVEIGSTPVEVEMHPWLQANIDAGNLTVTE
jgi:hypothetical protein